MMSLNPHKCPWRHKGGLLLRLCEQGHSERLTRQAEPLLNGKEDLQSNPAWLQTQLLGGCGHPRKQTCSLVSQPQVDFVHISPWFYPCSLRSSCNCGNYRTRLSMRLKGLASVRGSGPLRNRFIFLKQNGAGPACLLIPLYLKRLA